MNATGYADNNFINLTTENENGTITAYETLEEAVATILPINRRAGATLSFYNLNSDRLDRQAEFELWQFNSTDLANWENRDYWNNIYYNWNVFAGWYVGADGLKNHVKIPNVGQYAYVGTNLNDALLYQCRTNGTWTNTGIKVRNYISVVVGGNITIGDNGNWFSDGKDTGIPATPAVDEQLDNIIMQLQQHSTEIDKLQKQDVVLKNNIDSNFETINNKVDNIKTATDNKIDTADANLQNQITSNDTDIATLNTKHESLSRTVQGIAATGGASTATNVTYNNDSSRLNAENAQDAIDELQGSKIDKTSILQESGDAEDKVMSQKAVSDKLSYLKGIKLLDGYDSTDIEVLSNFKYFNQYNKDLGEIRIGTVYNTDSITKRIIVRTATRSWFFENKDEVNTENFSFAYDWDKHVNNINVEYNGAKIVAVQNVLIPLIQQNKTNINKVSESIDKVSENLQKRTEVLVPINTLEHSYLTRNGEIDTLQPTSTDFKIKIYKVTANTNYILFSDNFKLIGNFASVCFNDKLVTTGVLSNIILKDDTIVKKINVKYRTSKDGYLYIATANIGEILPYSTEFYDLSEEFSKVYEEVDCLEAKVESVNYRNPLPINNIVMSGSSISWGDGRLDGSFVGYLDKYIKENIATTITSEQLMYNKNVEIINNNLMYESVGRKISGIGAKLEFYLYGDEVSICQMFERTENYGIFTLKADGVVIGTYDNRNIIKSKTETFKGSNIRSVMLSFPCTFNHNIIINGVTTLTKIKYNEAGYGGSTTITDDTEALIYRGLDSAGNPVHNIIFNSSLGTITNVTITYNYGKIIAHERSTVGQTNDVNVNESRYGVGRVSYDPANPSLGGLSSGMEFRAIDSRSFIRYVFNSAKKRHFELELIGGVNPYFIVNFVTNRYFNLMNAGIGGWDVASLLDNNKINDYTQFYKWFSPDIIFQESATNDDWNNTIRRINRNIGKISKSELSQLQSLEISKIVYDNNTDTYDVTMATGIITEITATSLKSEDIKGTETQIGDIVRIGTYHGDNKQVICREISEVDISEGLIKWVEPINPDNILNIDNLDELIGAEINIRNLDSYKEKYSTLIEKIRTISPNTKIIIVATGLSLYGNRQLWGYDIIHKKLCGLYHNVKYCDVTNWIYNSLQCRISGNNKEVVNSTGSSEYTLNFSGIGKSWQGFKVLVDGIDVYGKDCYIQCGYFYTINMDKNGEQLNKNNVYDNRGVINTSIPMKLVFTKNIPSAGKQIIVQFSDISWSGDYCHPSELGFYLYNQMLCKFVK